MQQGADDAVDAVDDEDAQEVGHGHDDEAQGADDDGDDAEDDEAQGQFDTPRKAGRDDVDAMMRFLLLTQLFFIEDFWSWTVPSSSMVWPRKLSCS